ncbi:unnamed protein product [Alopecurus aequalis]
MFSLRIQSVELPDAFAALTTADADDVGTSSSAGSGTTASNPISPRSSNALTSTASATAPLELPGVTSAGSGRNPRIHRTRGVLHLYRSPSSSPASSYASAVAATPSSSSSSGPTPPSLPCDSLLPSWRGTRLLVLAVPTRVTPDDFVRFCGPYVEHASEIRVISDDGVEDRYSVLVEFEDQKSADGFYLDLNGWRFSSSEVEVCHALFIVAVQYTSSAEIAHIPPVGSTELPTCPVCIERLDQDISGIVATNCDHSFQCSCVSMWVSSSCPVCQFCQKQSESPTNPTCSVCQTSENLWICVICGFVGCGRYKEGHSIRHWKATQHCYSLDLETQRVWDYVGDSYVHRLNHSKSDAKHAKFGSKCEYSGGNCVNCSCNDDSDMGGVMFSSKTDTIVDEYNRLLASQLETQREMNEKLTKSQDIWRQTVKTIEERERSQLRLKDDTILDLEEQIKDFKYSIKLQKSIEKSAHADDLKGGMLVPLAMESDSGKGKRSSRSKRRN